MTFNSVGDNNYYFVYSYAFKIFWKTEESLRLRNIFVWIDHSYYHCCLELLDFSSCIWVSLIHWICTLTLSPHLQTFPKYVLSCTNHLASGADLTVQRYNKFHFRYFLMPLLYACQSFLMFIYTQYIDVFTNLVFTLHISNSSRILCCYFNVTTMQKYIFLMTLFITCYRGDNTSSLFIYIICEFVNLFFTQYFQIVWEEVCQYLNRYNAVSYSC